uniref:Ig-like domain-containing protein n=1 Tax=Macrostomum lignano TaxID=282301 RepID=A0A1I8FEU8_9PLAT
NKWKSFLLILVASVLLCCSAQTGLRSRFLATSGSGGELPLPLPDSIPAPCAAGPAKTVECQQADSPSVLHGGDCSIQRKLVNGQGWSDRSIGRLVVVHRRRRSVPSTRHVELLRDPTTAAETRRSFREAGLTPEAFDCDQQVEIVFLLILVVASVAALLCSSANWTSQSIFSYKWQCGELPFASRTPSRRWCTGPAKTA